LAERRTINVHVLGDERVHLAIAHLGRLQQGRLETLCGRLAVTQLSPFAAAAVKAADRCRVCFGKVDEDGLLKAELVEKRAPAKAKPSADVIDLAEKRLPKPVPVEAQPAAESTPASPPQATAKARKTTTAKSKPASMAKASSREKPSSKAKPPAKAKPASKANPQRRG
jgi:outer membrane biosynthesis protein TonB